MFDTLFKVPAQLILMGITDTMHITLVYKAEQRKPHKYPRVGSADVLPGCKPKRTPTWGVVPDYLRGFKTKRPLNL